MALGARLELRQGQSLVITPQLQQAIKLLQLSNLELETFVELELEKNPLLAREEPVAEAEPPSGLFLCRWSRRTSSSVRTATAAGASI